MKLHKIPRFWYFFYIFGHFWMFVA